MTPCPHLAAVVVNWRNYAVTADCLASVFAYAYQPLTVIVVDNESVPERLSGLQNRFPEAIYLPQHSNLGCGPGRNVGITKALELSAEIISFLDDDALITNGFFEKLVHAITSADDIGIVGPVNVFADAPGLVYVAGAQWHDWAGYERWLWFRQPYARLQAQTDALQAVDAVNGAGMTVRRAVFEQVGMFHPWLAPYGPEDIEFCLRARDHGFRTVLAANTRLLHRIPLDLNRGAWHRIIAQAELLWVLIGVLRPRRYAPTSIAVHLSRQAAWTIRALAHGQWNQAVQIVRTTLRGAWKLASRKWRVR